LPSPSRRILSNTSTLINVTIDETDKVTHQDVCSRPQ
jgi:hypothetical protein